MLVLSYVLYRLVWGGVDSVKSTVAIFWRRVVLTAGGASLLEEYTTYCGGGGQSGSRESYFTGGWVHFDLARRGSTSSGVGGHIYYCWRIKEGCV